MKDNKKKWSLTIGDILLAVLIVLKLCHVIDWSWWLVLSPLLVTVCLSIAFIVIGVTIKAVRKWKRLEI